MSGNVGGLVWDDSDQFARLAQGEPGLLYPQFRWFPDVLTLAVGHRHHTGDFSDDDVASGIWRPKGANDNFWVHDPDERMVYIGPGEHTDWGRRDEHLSSPEFVKHLVEALEAGTISRDRMYTVTLAVPQSVIFDADMHTDLTAKLNEIAPYIRSGQARYVTYSEAYDIWITHFGGRPTIYHRAGTVPRLPVIETTAVSSVTSSTASSGGHVASDGWAAVTARGVCWSTSSNPTLVDSHTVDGTGTGPFESAITGLSPGSTYHVRAYATNSVGTAYGSDLSFTSSSTNLPVPDIKANGLKGAVTVSAGSPVSITVGLDPGMYAGANADWWIAVHTPFSPPLDWYTYVVSIGWMQGIHLCAQTGLLKLSPVELLNRVLPSGNYVFYFAIDDPDRSPTGPWWGLDSVTVIVQ
jgi:hypothetical protein